MMEIVKHSCPQDRAVTVRPGMHADGETVADVVRVCRERASSSGDPAPVPACDRTVLGAR
ncbi:hypothetical protein GCM10023075_36530 [Streptosporangium album]